MQLIITVENPCRQKLECQAALRVFPGHIPFSIAFTAAARASFLVSRDNDDHDLRLMLPLKNNLAKDTYGFGYRIEEKNLSGIDTSCVTFP